MWLQTKSAKEQHQMFYVSLVDTHLTSAQKSDMEKLISKEEVGDVLQMLPASKAAGTDDLPYEFWKWIHQEASNRSTKDKDKEPLNIIECLTVVYNDIELHGVDPTTRFSEGWMCPLYKKKDRTDIANYQPITLLNSDYKIFTKALALQLAMTAPSVIHENQAGFIPGRSITDQIKLTQIIINYAEVTEQGGAIIALDQEKAYDEIVHLYLWTILHKFNPPEHFINIIRSLYEHAETSVLINGFRSSSYRVTRGV